LKEPDKISVSEVTDPGVYFNRRMFIRAGILAASAVATGMVYRRLNPVGSGKVNTPVIQGLVTATPTEAANGFRVDEPEKQKKQEKNYRSKKMIKNRDRKRV